MTDLWTSVARKVTSVVNEKVFFSLLVISFHQKMWVKGAGQAHPSRVELVHTGNTLPVSARKCIYLYNTIYFSTNSP